MLVRHKENNMTTDNLLTTACDMVVTVYKGITRGEITEERGHAALDHLRLAVRLIDRPELSHHYRDATPEQKLADARYVLTGPIYDGRPDPLA
jgi:hypothetical protein